MQHYNSICVDVWTVQSIVKLQTLLNALKCVRACMSVPGGELCPAAAVAIAKAEAGETGQREFSPD